MRIAVFSSKAYDRQFLDAANQALRHELVYFESHLSEETSALADGFPMAAGARYVSLEALLERSDVISLHVPLTPDTHHLIGGAAIAQMKVGVVLVNTSRGAVVDASALIQGLKTGRISAVGLDVYEEEADLFFEDLSNTFIQDDVFARLLTFPNVLITGHQGFFTHEALASIAETTLANATAFEQGSGVIHTIQVKAEVG